MIKQTVSVCVCTRCVLMGAVELAQMVLSLGELKRQIGAEDAIEVQTYRKHPACAVQSLSPYILLNGVPLEQENLEMASAPQSNAAPAKSCRR